MKIGLVLIMIVLAGCAGVQKPTIPLTEQVVPGENRTLIWQGYGTAFRFKDSGWVRDSGYDYEFTVLQRRFADHWESIKNMHRKNPNYNGYAGPRDSTLFFAISWTKESSKGLKINLHSSIGQGNGFADFEFREQGFTLEVADANPFYNRFRITQHYRYEDGRLLETEELFQLKDGKETPFMKMEEAASIFAPTKLPKAPTIFTN